MTKRYFLTGLLIWVPLGITVWVLKLLIGSMDQSLLLLPFSFRPESWLGMSLPGLGTILTIGVILLTGMLTTNIVGQRLIQFWESVLARIPVVKSIYYSVKQVSDTLFSGSGEAFRKVLLVRYPHPEAWSLAFQTNLPRDVGSSLDGEYVGVFVPTTPSPVNGFYFFVKKSETIEVGISVDDALKYIISMGVVTSADKESPARVYPGN
ncbi:transmembrane protein [Sulfuricella denitrificans skB26]|uniref:Transmembrane protein n=1 Tax=Sulfuricella denitrificans (strain DSM 22764 / NBRC 105220 / skB26) TaxID=1163617 RepID=S6AIY6_SULDS|nr:DUF502 domain-containing protein [Sulfuricella denitrificans]BAN34504.1 transmembrane protein [Sulfuricella denitrificans skB26]